MEVLSFEEVLDDLCSRFVLNIPEEELVSIERIYFQIEQAHWFYQDFYTPKNPLLPKLNLKLFAKRIMAHCPFLAPRDRSSSAVYDDFMQYKLSVPVCGAVILNEDNTKVLLVKGYSSKSTWTFPKGKIDKDESEWTCAIREVFEETGFDITPHLVQSDYIDLQLKEKTTRLYIIQHIAEDTEFTPQTRHEISSIAWHPISIPLALQKKHLYLVEPVIRRLIPWLKRKHDAPMTEKGKNGPKKILEAKNNNPSVSSSPSQSTSNLSIGSVPPSVTSPRPASARARSTSERLDRLAVLLANAEAKRKSMKASNQQPIVQTHSLGRDNSTVSDETQESDEENNTIYKKPEYDSQNEKKDVADILREMILGGGRNRKQSMPSSSLLASSDHFGYHDRASLPAIHRRDDQKEIEYEGNVKETNDRSRDDSRTDKKNSPQLLKSMSKSVTDVEQKGKFSSVHLPMIPTKILLQHGRKMSKASSNPSAQLLTILQSPP